MPQGRRKVPFSGKAKKAQLQTKKQNKTTNIYSRQGWLFCKQYSNSNI